MHPEFDKITVLRAALVYVMAMAKEDDVLNISHLIELTEFYILQYSSADLYTTLPVTVDDLAQRVMAEYYV